MQPGMLSGGVRRSWMDAGTRAPNSLWLPDCPCSPSYRIVRCLPRKRPILAVAQPLLESPAADTTSVTDLKTPPQQAAVRATRRARGSPEGPDEDPVLYPSNWQHRAWTWGTITLLTAMAGCGAAKMQDSESYLVAVLAAVVGYYIAGKQCSSCSAK